MEITGYDNVVFTTRTNAQIVRAFAADLRPRWPSAIIDVAFDPMTMDLKGITWDRLDGLLNDLASDRYIGVYLVQDRAMEVDMEKRGYAPGAGGEGPLALCVLTRPGVRFEAHRLEEVWAADRDRNTGSVDPYNAWLCSPSLQEVTLVTPDEPRRGNFSRWAHEVVLKACSTGG
jgi:hypothetical protein